jgi:hypothetical protein
MSTLARFKELREQLRRLMQGAPKAPPTETLGGVIDLFTERKFAVRRAEALLTEALVEFPLHPWLLVKRAIARLQLRDDEGWFTAAEDAKEDLALALDVAPDYLEPEIELAHFASLPELDDRDAAERFGALVEKVSSALCHCVAGRVQALDFDDRREEATAELTRWLSVFPLDAELRELARTHGVEVESSAGDGP